MKMTTTLSLLFCLLFVNEVQATVIAGPFSYNGHKYFLLSSNTWAGAEAEAISLGGHLVTVNDASENQFIANTFVGFVHGSPVNTDGNIWIGLHQVGNDYVWVSGEPVTYTNWSPPGPNSPDVVEMSMDPGFPTFGQWNDRPGYTFDFPHYGVVELVASEVPEPTTWLLYTIGCIGLFGCNSCWRRLQSRNR